MRNNIPFQLLISRIKSITDDATLTDLITFDSRCMQLEIALDAVHNVAIDDDTIDVLQDINHELGLLHIKRIDLTLNWYKDSYWLKCFFRPFLTSDCSAWDVESDPVPTKIFLFTVLSRLNDFYSIDEADALLSQFKLMVCELGLGRVEHHELVLHAHSLVHWGTLRDIYNWTLSNKSYRKDYLSTYSNFEFLDRRVA